MPLLKTTLLTGLAACVVAAASMMSPSRAVLADEYEWDATSGYHEEEWYDPSDWLDPTNGIDYEYDDYFGSYYDGDAYDVYDDTWYGNNYYTSDWYDEEPDFDNWYDDSVYDADGIYTDDSLYDVYDETDNSVEEVEEYEEAGNE